MSRHPEPPAWIRPGVRVRIGVRLPRESERERGAGPSSAPRLVSATELAEWRRSLIRILDAIEGSRQMAADEGVGGRISRLTRAGRIPRDVAAFMRTVTEMRNQTECEAKVLTPTESEAVTSAWRVVTDWADSRRCDAHAPGF